MPRSRRQLGHRGSLMLLPSDDPVDARSVLDELVGRRRRAVDATDVDPYLDDDGDPVELDFGGCDG
jgi:hypothetical protein